MGLVERVVLFGVGPVGRIRTEESGAGGGEMGGGKQNFVGRRMHA